MSNVLGREEREQILALGRLGWPLRRIEEATGVRRETASRYLRAAGIAVRAPGRWGHPPPKPAKEVSTDSVAWPTAPGRSPRASACEPYREWIEEAVSFFTVGGNSVNEKVRNSQDVPIEVWTLEGWQAGFAMLSDERSGEAMMLHASGEEEARIYEGVCW